MKRFFSIHLGIIYASGRSFRLLSVHEFHVHDRIFTMKLRYEIVSLNWLCRHQKGIWVELAEKCKIQHQFPHVFFYLDNNELLILEQDALFNREICVIEFWRLKTACPLHTELKFLVHWEWFFGLGRDVEGSIAYLAFPRLRHSMSDLGFGFGFEEDFLVTLKHDEYQIRNSDWVTW